jgi:hypothetical protein
MLSLLAVGCASNNPAGLTRALQNAGTAHPRYFGALSTSSTGADSPVLIQRTRGVGLKAQGGLVLGWFDDWQLSVARDCRVVVLVQKDTDPNKLQQQLSQQLKELVCVSSLP